jgi:hypothetical protein
MKDFQSALRPALPADRWTAALLAVAGLAGCYVVPIHPPAQSVPLQGVQAPPPGPLTFTARLYPANDLATGYGVVGAVVTNDLTGRGRFNTVIDGESFTGEATRAPSSSREGVANGAGNRGGYINCRYTMNNATLGTGSCRLNNGAAFMMHVGS